MIELRKYSKSELSQILKTNNNQSMKRKLERWGISFTEKGRGNNLEITITSIANPFKVYCITELEMGANTDFQKVRNLYYAFFNDDEFRAMPDEVKERRMRDNGKPVSRQTIADYLRKLDDKNYIKLNTGDYIYYFAYKENQRIVERQEYIKAWHEYWKDIDNGLYSREAIGNMIWNYGGVARKQEKPEINGIYKNAEIQYLCDLIQESIENEQQN
jgi:hypothetical protein